MKRRNTDARTICLSFWWRWCSHRSVGDTTPSWYWHTWPSERRSNKLKLGRILLWNPIDILWLPHRSVWLWLSLPWRWWWWLTWCGGAARWCLQRLHLLSYLRGYHLSKDALCYVCLVIFCDVPVNSVTDVLLTSPPFDVILQSNYRTYPVNKCFSFPAGADWSQYL